MGGIRDWELRLHPLITEDALWRAKQFVRTAASMTPGCLFWQALQACVGMSAKVKVMHVPSQDGQELYANIDKVPKA